MLLLITTKADKETLKREAKDLEGYIKEVVDVGKKGLTAGGVRHVDGEQLLLRQGSQQHNLWGGGLDLETGEMDFDSMINIRPNQGNSSREVLVEEIRNQMEEIIRSLLR